MKARVLSIAGSAAQGSAGIQADLKTFQERDVYGMAAITAIVANNSKINDGIFVHDKKIVKAQYDAALEHVGVDVVKMGMLFSKELIEEIATWLVDCPAKYIVLDPVMIGKMGSQLLADDAIIALKQKLIPLATVITPNLHEAEKLLNKEKITSVIEMEEAAKQLYGLGANYVLVKGGALKDQAIDVLFDGENFSYYDKPRVKTIHTSGAGCSYSSAIAAELSKGKDMQEAVRIAKDFVHLAIKHSLSFGDGVGSTDHAALRNNGYD